MKTTEENFIDWEASTFGYGYGTGELSILTALKTFMATIPARPDLPNGYDYTKLEAALEPTVTWLLINVLCKHQVDIIEYGTSPRFGWLTDKGMQLKAFIDSKTVDELVELCTSRTEDYIHCAPDYCNCGPKGYQEGVKCENPFW